VEIRLQENSPPFPGEDEFVDDLRRCSTPTEDAMLVALLAIAYEGARVRIVVRCETEEEDIAITAFLEERGFVDLLTESKDADKAIGRTAADKVRRVIGHAWDALYVRQH
jgi:hypothetical protein